MKIRYGFVSNSSSSSFTCDVCGETQSGMDMSRSEAGMTQCRHGHTYCLGHQCGGEEPTIEQMRADMKKIQVKSWRKPEEIAAEQAKFDTMPEQELRDTYEEYNNEESFGHDCPICQLTDLPDYDVARYFMVKNGFKTTKEVAAALKAEFGTYDAFINFIRPPKV